jgi:hypothetical protein
MANGEKKGKSWFAPELVYPVPVMATLKLNDVTLELIEEDTVSVRVALADAPAARL